MSDEPENEIPTRKKNRLENFDYSSCGAYFVTICTEGRRPILSRIVGGGVLDAPISVELCIYGQVADRYIRQMNDFYHDIQVKRYVIMPNHVHMILRISAREVTQGPMWASAPTDTILNILRAGLYPALLLCFC